MRVCLETTALRSQLSGVGNYVLGLADALKLRQDIELFSFDGIRFSPLEDVLRTYLDDATSTNQKIEKRIYGILRKAEPVRAALRELKALTFRRSVPPLDLFHALNFMPPVETKIKCIPLIYDLSHVRHPDTHPRERVEWLKSKLKNICNYPMLNTISDFTADEIAEVYKYPRDSIRVTYPGINKQYFESTPNIMPLTIGGTTLKPSQFFLTVGTLEPRKNHKTLLDAYSQLSFNERAEFPLVVVGQYGWGINDTESAVKLRQEGSLIIANYVHSALLKPLYSQARAFLFPSLYEGFGLPVAEAMVAGTPVIASDIAVHREIGGTYISYAKTLQPEAWCEAMRVAIDTSKQLRDTNIATAQNHAGMFTWKKNAFLTQSMYRERLSL